MRFAFNFKAEILHNYSVKGIIFDLNSYQTASIRVSMSIQLNGINCFYGAHQALFDITLDCPQGETLVLLGPSGAVKARCCVYSICLRCRAPVRSTLQATISISPKPL